MAVKVDDNVLKTLRERATRTEAAEASARAAAQLLALFIYAHGGRVEIPRQVMRSFNPTEGTVSRHEGADQALVWQYTVDGEVRSGLPEPDPPPQEKTP